MLEKTADCVDTMLRRNTSIRRLRLRNAGIGDRSLIKISKGIAEHPTLGELDLSNNVFENEGLEHLINAIRHTGTLKSLHFANLDINIENATKLADFVEKSHIWELALKEVEVDHESLKKIIHGCTKGPYLRVLDFNGTPIGP